MGVWGTKSENLCITYFLKINKIFWHCKYCVLWDFMVKSSLTDAKCLWEGQQIIHFSFLDILFFIEKIVLYSSFCNYLFHFLSCL